MPNITGIKGDPARALVTEFLGTGGGWLPPEMTAALLRCYGIPLAELVPVRSEDQAVDAFAAGGGSQWCSRPTCPGWCTRPTPAGSSSTCAPKPTFAPPGGKLRTVLVQPMIGGGTELIVGVAADHLFGPLVLFGLGGVATDVLADYAARLTPLTDIDADTLIRSIRSGPLLLGHRASPAASGAEPRPQGQAPPFVLDKWTGGWRATRTFLGPARSGRPPVSPAIITGHTSLGLMVAPGLRPAPAALPMTRHRCVWSVAVRVPSPPTCPAARARFGVLHR